MARGREDCARGSFSSEVPLLAGVAALAEQGVVPGGTKTNLAHAAKWVRFPEGLPRAGALRAGRRADQRRPAGRGAPPEGSCRKALRALAKAKVERAGSVG